MLDSVAIKTTALTENDQEMIVNYILFYIICPGKISLKRHLSQKLNNKREQAKEASFRVGITVQVWGRSNKSPRAETGLAWLRIVKRINSGV